MSLESLIATGTKVWLDGVEPNEIAKNRDWGITGATSNPTIVSKIIGHGHFDDRISDLIAQGLTPEALRQIATPAAGSSRLQSQTFLQVRNR